MLKVFGLQFELTWRPATGGALLSTFNDSAPAGAPHRWCLKPQAERVDHIWRTRRPVLHYADRLFIIRGSQRTLFSCAASGTRLLWQCSYFYQAWHSSRCQNTSSDSQHSQTVIQDAAAGTRLCAAVSVLTRKVQAPTGDREMARNICESGTHFTTTTEGGISPLTYWLA